MYQEIVERYGFKLECTYAERETMEGVLEHIETKLEIAAVNLNICYIFC